MNAAFVAKPVFVAQEGRVEETRTEKGILPRFPKKEVTVLRISCKAMGKPLGPEVAGAPLMVTWIALGGVSSSVRRNLRPGQQILAFGYPHSIQGGLGNALILTRWYALAPDVPLDKAGQNRRMARRALYPASWGPLSEISMEKIHA